MKATIEYSWVLAAVIVLGAVGGYFLTDGFANFPTFAIAGLNPACQIVKPTWSYYSCEKSSSPAAPVTSQASTAGSGLFSKQFYPFASCNNDRIVEFGFPESGVTCKVTYSAGDNAPTTIAYRITSCSGTGCSGSISKGQIINVPRLGQQVDVELIKPLIGDVVVTSTTQYYTKQLYLNTFEGFRQQVGAGCDVRALRPSSEWNKLPSGSEVNFPVGDTAPFVSGSISVPTTGNSYTYSGQQVIAVPSGGKYLLYPLSLLTAKMNSDPTPVTNVLQSTGQYSAISGSCYYVPGNNPIATVDCVPGVIIQGFTCQNFQLVPITPDVQPECSTALQCPGQGGVYYNPTSKSISTYTCQSSRCVSSAPQTVECYPPAVNCASDQVCDLATYRCVAAPQQLSPCPYDWCPSGSVYQPKSCQFGKYACQTAGNYFCSDQPCSPETTPPAGTQGGGIGGIPWSVIFAGIAAALAFLIAGRDAINSREGVGMAIAGIFAIVAFVVTWYIVENIFAILVGSIILTILGGVILFIFGPALIFIFAVLAEIIRRLT